MLTLGVDLASQDAKTAICMIGWREGRAEVQRLEPRVRTEATLEVGNEAILRLMREADATGIDAPFGWPARFLTAIRDGPRTGAGQSRGMPRPCGICGCAIRIVGSTARRTGPLSVSADGIAVCAMRAAALLAPAAADGRPPDRVIHIPSTGLDSLAFDEHHP